MPHTHKRLTAVMEGLGSYEIIYVNDGSRDNTLSILKELAEKDPHVVAVDFSRNFGQQAAVTAGMARRPRQGGDPHRRRSAGSA